MNNRNTTKQQTFYDRTITHSRVRHNVRRVMLACAITLAFIGGVMGAKTEKGEVGISITLNVYVCEEMLTNGRLYARLTPKDGAFKRAEAFHVTYRRFYKGEVVLKHRRLAPGFTIHGVQRKGKLVIESEEDDPFKKAYCIPETLLIENASTNQTYDVVLKRWHFEYTNVLSDDSRFSEMKGNYYYDTIEKLSKRITRSLATSKIFGQKDRALSLLSDNLLQGMTLPLTIGAEVGLARKPLFNTNTLALSFTDTFRIRTIWNFLEVGFPLFNPENHALFKNYLIFGFLPEIRTDDFTEYSYLFVKLGWGVTLFNQTAINVYGAVGTEAVLGAEIRNRLYYQYRSFGKNIYLGLNIGYRITRDELHMTSTNTSAYTVTRYHIGDYHHHRFYGEVAYKRMGFSFLVVPITFAVRVGFYYDYNLLRDLKNPAYSFTEGDGSYSSLGGYFSVQFF